MEISVKIYTLQLKYIRTYLVIFLLIFSTKNLLAQEKSILEKRISINFNNELLEDALDKLSKKGGFNFSYNSKIISRKKTVSGRYKNEKIGSVLSSIIADPEIVFKEFNNQVIFYKKQKENTTRSSIVSKPSKLTKIYGRVIDKATKKGISNVHVFVSNSTIGATTNSEGYFELLNPVEGNIELVFSHVSYVTIIRSSKKINLNSKDLIFELAPHPIRLKEIELVDKQDKDWNKNLRLFTNAFIGATDNSRKCKIINPWILDFNVDTQSGKFSATADELLEIENKKIGYNISIYLMLFEIVDGRPKYLYKAFFKEIKPISYAQKKRWKKARSYTYKGSLRHFIDALYTGNLNKEGFKISLSNSLTRNAFNSGSLKKTHLDSIIRRSNSDKGKEVALAFNNYLWVTYFKRNESSKYLQYLQKQNQDLIEEKLKGPIELKPFHQQSWLKINPHKNIHLTKNKNLIINNKSIRINDKKQIINPLDMEQYGYWAWKRIADELPNDYVLSN